MNPALAAPVRAVVIARTGLAQGGILHLADLDLFVAVLAAATGYAEGGRLSQTMGGRQLIPGSAVVRTDSAARPGAREARYILFAPAVIAVVASAPHEHQALMAGHAVVVPVSRR